jgi:type IV secretion system protein VirB10
MMADTAKPNRPTVDQTPDPEDIERTPATERASKMPSMPGTAMDPKKMIGFAAAAGAVMFTVLAQARTRTHAL